MSYIDQIDFHTVKNISYEIDSERGLSKGDPHHNPMMTLIRVKKGFTLPSDNCPGVMHHDESVYNQITRSKLVTTTTITEEVDFHREVGLEYKIHSDPFQHIKDIQAYPTLSRSDGLLTDEDFVTTIADSCDLPMELKQLYPNLF